MSYESWAEFNDVKTSYYLVQADTPEQAQDKIANKIAGKILFVEASNTEDRPPLKNNSRYIRVVE